ncbi:MAG: sugar phosphate isomerase/epimerase [Tannerella sp.]|jgi:sugar phosphate isomerase/epimerase|nr:sugar phosphate isomerase/epimerase [Tannerella sp.]
MKSKFKSIAFMTVFLLTVHWVTGQKPNSRFNGVQIGVITYSYRELPDQSLPAILDCVVKSGINSIELLGDAVERYAGVPKGDKDAIRQWRTTVSMDKFKAARKMFKDRGIDIHMLNMGVGDLSWSDEELDYAFRACKAVGAKGIATEISEDAAKRLAPFADKHKLYVIFHNHGQPGQPDFSFDRILQHGKRLMLNLDVGHYFGATGVHPNEVIQRLHDRIFSIHVKDKTSKTASAPNQIRPFGKGDTPLADIFQLIKKENWKIYCDIELEYKVPADSDPVKEVIKCVEYCKQILQQIK